MTGNQAWIEWRALASMIEHTQLKPESTPVDTERLCAEGLMYGFHGVCVYPTEVERCAKALEGSGLAVITVAAFPTGRQRLSTKESEVKDSLAIGANEVDMVMNFSAARSGLWGIVECEAAMLSEACQSAGAISKLILETSTLTDDEKALACKIAMEAGVSFVKTSTGFGGSGATVHDVRLLRGCTRGRGGVKASGGIRDLGQLREMIAAGADRIGTSASVVIAGQYGSGSIH